MNTQKTSTKQRREEATSEKWPLKLNKALIAIGVIAFGLIVTDRLLEAFRADDVPDIASTDGSTVNGLNEAAADELSGSDKIRPDERESLVELQNLIGSRVVFVSATESGYVVAEDERRIAVGDALDDSTTLAEVTTHQVILEKSSGLTVINLPDPTVQ